MRATLRNGVEVRLEGNELLVLPMCGEEKVGLRSVVLEVIHLSMQEPVLEDCMVCWTLVLACSVSQTEEGKVRRELLDPVSSGRRRYAYAKLFANASEYLGEGVESVVPRERLNNDPHRVGAVLRGEWREPAFTERAPEQLHRSVLGDANAVFGKVGAFAVWTHDRGFGGAALGAWYEWRCVGGVVSGEDFFFAEWVLRGMYRDVMSACVIP